MGQYNFGAGFMFAVPPGANPTPQQFGTMQEAGIDFAASNKSLFGQMRFAEAVAQGQMKVTGKAKFAKIKVATYNSIFFNETVKPGMTLAALNEPGTIAAGGITVANSATFSQDLGVIDALTGKPYTCVGSAPSAGQYSVAAGVYTFAAGDTGKAVYICYLYTDATNGSSITINNQPMGAAPSFKAIFNGRFSGKQITLILNCCVSSKLNLISTKLEDFSIPEFDFEASVDAGGVLGLLSANE